MKQAGRSFGLCVIFLVLGASSALSGDPVLVSPGASDRTVTIADPCPTFSWGGAEKVDGFELVVYRLPDEEATPHREAPVIRVALPAAATSWTPSAAKCLEPGGRYAWSLGAVGRRESPSWTQPHLFRVNRVPSVLEAERAARTLQLFLEATAPNAVASEPALDIAQPDRSPPEVGETLASASAAPTFFSVDGSGNVAAPSFTGDGSALENVVASDLVGSAVVSVGELDFDPVTEAELTSHGNTSDAHHTPVANCSGLACDGTLFTNLDWDNLIDLPGGFDDDVDNDTTYTAGSGLTLVGTEFSASGAPVYWGQQTTQHTIGSGAANTGGYSSITIGSDGLPVMSYYDYSGKLMVARCDDAACTDETVTMLDSGSGVGVWTSIALGLGYPLISYHDDGNGYLKTASCDQAACTSADISTVDDTANVGRNSSVVFGSDGRPVISYLDETNNALKVAKCNDTECLGSDETLTPVDTPGGSWTSIAIGTDGFPVISYSGGTPAGLKVAKCNDHACAGADETISAIDTATLVGTSIAIGIDGFPIIAYVVAITDDLKVVKCNDIACSGADETITTVDSASKVDPGTSITIGNDGYPVIVFGKAHPDRDLMFIHCNDFACAGADEVILNLEKVNNTGGWPSITIGPDGNPVISHGDPQLNDMLATHCGSPYCVSYFRR